MLPGLSKHHYIAKLFLGIQLGLRQSATR